MAAVTKEGFRRAKAPQVVRVELPEAGPGEYACLRPLSASGLRVLRGAQGAEGDTSELGFVHHVLAHTLCDDAGEPVFASAEDLAQNFDLSLPTLQRLAEEAIGLSGLAVREKNSPRQSATPTPSAGD